MISRAELLDLARARIRDAEALRRAGRYDGAVYLAGYAVELCLKARICRTLRWQGFPETTGEFHGFTSLKTHNLDVLLRLSGVEAKVKATSLGDWSLAAQWSPEIRYRPAGSATATDADDMLLVAKNLRRALA
jgi:hypothetical protein